ncbi:MAG: hypothetical protein HDT39_13745 [Lachnospiraceae bacterium]|nr:hypothetical protein [Lachnospiraceae bacterium]
MIKIKDKKNLSDNDYCTWKLEQLTSKILFTLWLMALFTVMLCSIIFKLTINAKADTGNITGGGKFLPPDVEGCTTKEVKGDIGIYNYGAENNFRLGERQYTKAYIACRDDAEDFLWAVNVKELKAHYLYFVRDSRRESEYSSDYHILSFYTRNQSNSLDALKNFEKPDSIDDYDKYNGSKSTLKSGYTLLFNCSANMSNIERTEYDINYETDIPIHYKTLETAKEFNDWINNNEWDLYNHPDQDYSDGGFTEDGDMKENVLYDLEVPKNIKVDGWKESFLGSRKNLIVTWKQSDSVNVEDWQTELYYREKWKIKRFPWSASEVRDTGYTKEYDLYGVTLNFKNRYTFEKDIMDNWIKNAYETGGTYDITDKYVRLRNAWYEEDKKIMHYSNWITWHVDMETGKIDVTENEDKDPENTEEDNVKTDSEDYPPGDDYTDKNNDNTSYDLDGFLEYLKSAIAAIGDVPDMLGKVFSFLPPYFVTAILIGIGLLIILRLLGR